MENLEKKTSTTQKEIKVNPNTVIGSQYAQIVGITVTDVDFTLEFVYINPQIKTEGNAIARITMPRSTATELVKVIEDTLKQHETNKKKS